MKKAKAKGQGNRWSKKLAVARLAEQKAKKIANKVSRLGSRLRKHLLAFCVGY